MPLTTPKFLYLGLTSPISSRTHVQIYILYLHLEMLKTSKTKSALKSIWTTPNAPLIWPSPSFLSQEMAPRLTWFLRPNIYSSSFTRLPLLTSNPLARSVYMVFKIHSDPFASHHFNNCHQSFTSHLYYCSSFLTHPPDFPLASTSIYFLDRSQGNLLKTLIRSYPSSALKPSLPFHYDQNNLKILPILTPNSTSNAYTTVHSQEKGWIFPFSLASFLVF